MTPSHKHIVWPSVAKPVGCAWLLEDDLLAVVNWPSPDITVTSPVGVSCSTRLHFLSVKITLCPLKVMPCSTPHLSFAINFCGAVPPTVPPKAIQGHTRPRGNRSAGVVDGADNNGHQSIGLNNLLIMINHEHSRTQTTFLDPFLTFSFFFYQVHEFPHFRFEWGSNNW